MQGTQQHKIQKPKTSSRHGTACRSLARPGVAPARHATSLKYAPVLIFGCYLPDPPDPETFRNLFDTVFSCPETLLLRSPKRSQVVPNGPKWSQVVPRGPKRSQGVPWGPMGPSLPSSSAGVTMYCKRNLFLQVQTPKHR